MKSTPTLKKWPFFKVRKKALVVVRSSKFKLNKKISLKICNFYLYDIFRGPFLHLEKCTCRCKVFFGPPCMHLRNDAQIYNFRYFQYVHHRPIHSGHKMWCNTVLKMNSFNPCTVYSLVTKHLIDLLLSFSVTN